MGKGIAGDLCQLWGHNSVTHLWRKVTAHRTWLAGAR